MNQTTDTTTPALLCGEGGYDPIEDRLRQNIRATIEALFEEELEAVMGRCRYGRNGGSKKGYRHGHRERQLVGTFGTDTLSVPRGSRTKRARSSMALPGWKPPSSRSGAKICRSSGASCTSTATFSPTPPSTGTTS